MFFFSACLPKKFLYTGLYCVLKLDQEVEQSSHLLPLCYALLHITGSEEVIQVIGADFFFLD